MTREEKVKKRKERAKRRKEKRDHEFRLLVTKSLLHARVPFRGLKNNAWEDSNSPTGWSQVCSYEVYGTCQYPCNGDC